VWGIEIGVGLTAFGLFFMMMGVMMLFDAGLMAIGNVRTIKREYNNNNNNINTWYLGVVFMRYYGYYWTTQYLCVFH
jgi:hypothetical protein